MRRHCTFMIELRKNDVEYDYLGLTSVRDSQLNFEGRVLFDVLELSSLVSPKIFIGYLCRT